MYMKLLDKGYPMRRLSRETNIVRSRLYMWRKRYIAYGEEGLRRKVARIASESEKASVKIEMMEKALPLRDICIKYDVSEAAIYSWLKTEGKQHPMAKSKNKASLKELEELRARNEYLEAENALLKNIVLNYCSRYAGWPNRPSIIMCLSYPYRTNMMS